MVPMTVEKYGTRASTVVLLRAVWRLQPQFVADPYVECRAEILREHHAPTGEHLVA